MSVLVLNATYEPLQILPLTKVIKLMAKERVEVIKNHPTKVIRGMYQSYQLPTVVKLHQYVRYNQKPVPWSKKNVLVRDNYTCQYCGDTKSRMTIDHVQPQSKQGPSTWDNTVACCVKCNSKKADKTLKQSGLTLTKVPKRPVPLMFMKRSSHNRSEWDEFMYV